MRVSVLAAVLVAVAWPSVAHAKATQVGPEFPAADPVYVSAAPSQSRPRMAFDGTNYLMVWQEDREYQFGDVYASRVAPDGTVLDPHGIPLGVTAGWQGNPAVAFDGTNYLVTWDEGGYPDGDIYAARVSPGGANLDPGGFPVSNAIGLQAYSAVAFDGTDYLVTWTSAGTGGGGGDVYAARVTTSGAVLDPNGIAVSAAPQEQGLPSVGFDGTNFFVTWMDDRNLALSYDVYGARVTPGGAVLDPTGIVLGSAPNNQWGPSVAFDGVNYLVAWEDDRAGASMLDIYGTRVQPDGTVLDPAGIPISTAQDFQRQAIVAFGGTTFMVVWSDSRPGGGTYGARVSSGGVVLDPSGIPISTSGGGDPSIAFGSTNYLVAWDAFSTFQKRDLFAARVTTAGSVLDPGGLPIDRKAPSDQMEPAVAFGGGKYFAVWQDHRSGNSDIYGARVTPDGARLDGAGLPIAVSGAEQLNPSVSYDGTLFLVVWEENGNIFGLRVGLDGGFYDQFGFPISTASGVEGQPAVSSNGGDWLVVWQDSRNTASGVPMGDGRFGPPPPPPPPPPPTYDVYGSRVTINGAVLDPAGMPVSTASGDQVAPAVAWGGDYLVAWSDSRSDFADVYGTRVDGSGAVLDPSGIPIAAVGGTQSGVAVTEGSGTWLVAWQDTRDSGPEDIYGARLGADGSVFDPGGFPINHDAGYQVSPAVAYDWLNYFALWDEPPYAPGLNVYGTRVSAAGALLDPGGIPVSEAGTVLGAPAAVGGYPYHVGLAYDRVGSEPPWGGAQRIFLRDFSEGGPPPPPPPQPPPPISPPPPQPPPPPVRCRVPRVIGLRLATAKRRIRRAHCSVGRIQRVHTRRRLRGRVVRQSPRARSVRRPGYPVRLVVGRL